MSEASDLQIRPMSRRELDVALRWADSEGWNPGLSDADCFYAADPGGFLIGCLEEEPVACISSVRYGENYGFVGLYIVRPDLRGRGYGFCIWKAGMSRLDGRVAGLDGVIAQQPNYARSGFLLAHRNIRFGGTPQLAPITEPRLIDIGSRCEAAIMDYDEAFFPAPRSAFLRCWLRPQNRKALALVNDGKVEGYGVIRACRRGFKIGPLFANNEAGADLLFRALAADAQGQSVFVDCPEPNRMAADLAARYGLSPVFETARMYRGPVPDVAVSRTYGITTFELG